MTPGRWAVLGALVLAPAACLDPPTGPVGPDDEVRVLVPAGVLTDSIEAVVTGAVVSVVRGGSEDEPIPDMRVFFVPRGEGCGTVQEPVVLTDDEGRAGTPWRLGVQVGTCTLDVLVRDPGGLQVATAGLEVEVLPGQADLLEFVPPVDGRSGAGVLALTEAGDLAFDRFSNEVPWRFRVLDGPLLAAGTEFGSDGARTLVPTAATGSGRVAVETRWGDALVLEAEVSATGEAVTVTVRRPGPAGPPA